MKYCFKIGWILGIVLLINTNNFQFQCFFSVIFNVQDEVDYWKTIQQKKDVSKKEKEAVSTFCDLFQDISEEIR